jgi:hypothetical protein
MSAVMRHCVAARAQRTFEDIATLSRLAISGIATSLPLNENAGGARSPAGRARASQAEQLLGDAVGEVRLILFGPGP